MWRGETWLQPTSSISLKGKSFIPSIGLAKRFTLGLVSWHRKKGVPCNSDGKELLQCLDQEDPLEKEMATHSSILAWKIPWTEEPGRLQSMGSQSWTVTNRTNFGQLKENGSKLKLVKLTPTESWELSDLGDFLKLCGFCYPKKKGNTGKIYDLVTRGIEYER